MKSNLGHCKRTCEAIQCNSSVKQHFCCRRRCGFLCRRLQLRKQRRHSKLLYLDMTGIRSTLTSGSLALSPLSILQVLGVLKSEFVQYKLSSGHRVKYGLDHWTLGPLDYFLDYFLDYVLDYFLDHFLDHFLY